MVRTVIQRVACQILEVPGGYALFSIEPDGRRVQRTGAYVYWGECMADYKENRRQTLDAECAMGAMVLPIAH